MIQMRKTAYPPRKIHGSEQWINIFVLLMFFHGQKKKNNGLIYWRI